MKLITLNIWAGKIYEPLLEFIKCHSKDTDIFCLQEIFNDIKRVPEPLRPYAKLNIASDLINALPDFDMYTAPSEVWSGCGEVLTIFLRKNLRIEKSDNVKAYVGPDFTVNVQYVQFALNNERYTVCNIHGYWDEAGKGDNPARLKQSTSIKKFLDSVKGKRMICGDFNMAPDTESTRIIEGSMRNLIKEYKITSTRSHFYRHEDTFADYIFVSKEVAVNKFAVLNDVVSDHLPLLLEFS